jgi:sialic acid synthase SpsE
MTTKPPYVIAEISSNHNGDLGRAKELVRGAAEAGANAVKFQLFTVGELFDESALTTFPNLRERSKWELPRDFIPILREEATSAGMEFGCTPFDLDSARFLVGNIDFFKIASYELLWHDLVRSCAISGLPVILSTGMSTEIEVHQAVDAFLSTGSTDLSILHCVSSYPAAAEDANLSVIPTLRERFKFPTGWSDHSHDFGTVLRAAFRWSADILELHFDLDGTGAEAESGHCWLPEELAQLTTALKNGLEADGIGLKQPALSELHDREWRADPSDGLRPLLETRKLLNGN